MKKHTFLLILITGIVSVFGFAKSMTLAFFFGASPLADAYIIGTTVPLLLFSFFDHAVKSGYIPIYSEIYENKGKNESQFFTNNLISLLTIFLLFLYFIIFLFAEYIILLVAPGLEIEIKELAIMFIKITSLSIALLGITSIFRAYLNYKRSYSIPAISAIPMDIIILISIYLGANYNVMYLAYGYLIGSLIQMLFLIPFAYKHEFKYRFRLNIKEDNIKFFFILILPILFSVAVNDINKIVDKSIASLVASGGISALNYSSKITDFVQATVVLSISTVLFPLLSKYSSLNNVEKIKKHMKESLNLIILIVVPATFGIIFFSKEIVELLYARGRFDENSIMMTSKSMMFYSLGMIGFGFNSVYTRYFFSIKNSRVPMFNAIIISLTNILLNFIFYFFTNLGIIGLALSTSISTILGAIWLMFKTYNEIGNIYEFSDVRFISIVLLSSSIMVFISKQIMNWISIYTDFNQNFLTIFIIFISIILYAISLILFFKKEFTEQIKNIFFKWRRTM